MERLTRRSANGTGVYATPSGEPVKWENNRHNVLQKLADYEDLEEQGRLLKLPCKVGDTVWQIMVIRIRGGENKNIEYGYGIFEAMVTELLIDDNMNILISTTTKGGEYRNEVTSAAIGETMFFTESEAEAKLKELRGEENE